MLLAEVQAEALLVAKLEGRELDLGPRSESIDSLIEAELRRHEAAGGFRRAGPPDRSRSSTRC